MAFEFDLEECDFKVRSLFVLVTNRCNLVCKHCYVSSGPDGAVGLDFESVAALAREFNNLHGRSILTLSGGEILSRRDAVDAIELLQAWHNVFVLTNATLINADRARRLRDAAVAIRIGLDGPNAESHDQMRGRGAFDRAMRGVHVLQDAGFDSRRIEFFFTAVEWNVDQIADMLTLADKLNITKVHVEPVAVHGRALEHWPKTEPGGRDLFRQRYKRSLDRALGLRAGEWQIVDHMKEFQTLTVYSDGRAFPYTPVDEIDETTGYLGNVLVDPLKNILNPSNFHAASMLKLMRHLRGRGRTAAQVRLARVGTDPSTVFQ